MFRTLVLGLAKVFFGIRSESRDHIPRNGAVLLVANHLSHLDPAMIGVTCPRRIRFLAREDLRRAPIIGALVRGWGIIPVFRDTRRQASSAVDMALQALGKGQMVAIFPEGTRSEDGRLMPSRVRSGAAVLALRSRATVIPAGIRGTNRVLPKGSNRIRRHPVVVRYGPPLDFSEFHGQRITRDITREVTRRILSAIQELLPPEHQAESLDVLF